MREDRTLQADVMRELERNPAVDPAHIGVSVRDAAVTLTGRVSSYNERVEAIRAVERVYGVRAIADQMLLDAPGSAGGDDSLIAEAIAHALRWNDAIPDTIEAEVSGGLVTLRGQAEWPVEVDRARRVVQKIDGVRGVSSAVTLRHQTAN